MNYEGEKVLGVHSYIPKIGWCLLTETNQDEILNTPLKNMISRNIYISITIILIFTVVGFFVGNYFEKKNGRQKSTINNN